VHRIGRIAIDILAGILVLGAIASWARIPARLFEPETDGGGREQVTRFVQGGSPPSAPTPTRPCDRQTLIGTVAVGALIVRSRPSASSPPVMTLTRTNQDGAPQVVDLLSSLRDASGDDWYEALLPMRPNGSSGYIAAGSVRVTQTPYRVEVDRHHLRLTVWRGCERLMRFPLGLGKESTPTPDGTYYIIALLKPPTPDSVYGEYAYGLSAFSDALTDWKDGGIIGLHGTNDPSSIGRRESHGCIRMNNADILRLVPLLPLGTPVQIV
jgi:lipoprotein-anchoring transpeptidase ErfK/SrfK